MAAMESSGTASDEKNNHPTLEDRVEAIEDVVIDLMALAVREESSLRPTILKALMKLIRETDWIDHGDDDRPDKEYRAKSPRGKAVQRIRNDFIENT